MFDRAHDRRFAPVAVPRVVALPEPPGTFRWLLDAWADPRGLQTHLRGASANSILALVVLCGLGAVLGLAPFLPATLVERWPAFALESLALAGPLGVLAVFLQAGWFRVRLRLCGVDDAPPAPVFAVALLLELVPAAAIVAATALSAIAFDAPRDGIVALRAFVSAVGPLCLFRAWMAHHFAGETFGARGAGATLWFLLVPGAFWTGLSLSVLGN
jgi:hypothetical protein